MTNIGPRWSQHRLTMAQHAVVEAQQTQHGPNILPTWTLCGFIGTPEPTLQCWWLSPRGDQNMIVSTNWGTLQDSASIQIMKPMWRSMTQDQFTWNALHHFTSHCSTWLCSTLHCMALHSIGLHSIPLGCIAMHYITLRHITLHVMTWNCIALYCINYLALHCIASYFHSFHSAALHCMMCHNTAFHWFRYIAVVISRILNINNCTCSFVCDAFAAIIIHYPYFIAGDVCSSRVILQWYVWQKLSLGFAVLGEPFAAVQTEYKTVKQ